MIEVFRKRKAQMLLCVLLLVEGIALVYYESLIIAWEENDISLRIRSLWNDEDRSVYIGKKKILLWTQFFEEDWLLRGETGNFDHCPMYNNCIITRSRDLVNIKNFNAILFNANEMNSSDLPRSRSPRQKYVFVNHENPKNLPLADSYFEGYFNVTMTYRLDSDIPWPYYILRNMHTQEMVAPLYTVEWIKPTYENLVWNFDLRFNGKKKTAAWIVSDCDTHGKRELLVEELEEFIQVDRIGKCAEEVIPDCIKSADNCFAEVIEPNYFFYFSFENTLCQDYVTGHFFNALSYDVIPVVYGGANYSFFAPPHSYIDVLDFNSTEELALYLTDLSQNREEYLKYFWWKRIYTVHTPRHWTLCKICEQINIRRPHIKTYSSLNTWYKKDKCPIQDALNGTKHATKALRSQIINPPKVSTDRKIPSRKYRRKHPWRYY